MVVESLTPLFCCVDGFIISRLYFLCHNFPKVSELNSKTAINVLIPSLTVDFNNPPNYYIFHANSRSTNIPHDMGNQFIVLNSITNNDMYGGMLVIGFGGSKIAYKNKNNSNTWSNWKYINFTN